MIWDCIIFHILMILSLVYYSATRKINNKHWKKYINIHQKCHNFVKSETKSYKNYKKLNKNNIFHTILFAH